MKLGIIIPSNTEGGDKSSKDTMLASGRARKKKRNLDLSPKTSFFSYYSIL